MLSRAELTKIESVSRPTDGWVLGLDIGASSLGWAALRCKQEEPAGILGLGVRVFPAGMERLESGRDESHAAKRRQARLARRQTDRRGRRLKKLYNLLAGWGLLPTARNPEERNQVLSKLDLILARKYNKHDKLPYLLRARALDHALGPFELGRAFFHLGQRRGFLSNRKAQQKKEEGRVLKGITSLDAEMAQSGARTLGEFFLRFNPHQKRIRGNYTARQMYEQEFEHIWTAQMPYHPKRLTPDRQDVLHRAIFWQRPLRDQSRLIGKCELEPLEPRAPVWHPLVQRFRLLQEVNSLRLVDAAGVQRSLSQSEREKVVRRLERGDLPLKTFRNLLELDESTEINLEEGGKKGLVGDRTAHAMRAVFGKSWDEMPQQERIEALEDLAGEAGDEALLAKARDRWGLDEDHAKKYVSAKIEAGKYAAFSLKATERLMPHLECGIDVTTARIAEYPETLRTDVRNSLPPVLGTVDVRNPAVLRALTELRKVVNALIRRYGKPREIHIELARDLKAPKPERERRWERMRRNEKERKRAADHLLREGLIPRPSRADIEKWLLAEECDFSCPYTGRRFSAAQLYGAGEIQVDHIIPFPRSLDDSFANKTLCYASANAAKGNRTSLETWGDSPEWDEILERVRRFKGNYRSHKLRRFQWSTEEVDRLLNDFTTRQLSDTRYSSRTAARYLASLYGGRYDADGRQRIFASPGAVTALLRQRWGIHGLFSADGQKSREDHRHHAVDAVVTALTGPRWVKALGDAAADAYRQGRSRISSIDPPWAEFARELREAVDRIVVSHRVRRKVGGAMHKETFYGRIRDAGGNETTVVRKPVHLLSKLELEQIVDPAIRERVRLQWNLLEGKATSLESDPPTLPAAGGRHVPIRKVRIRIAETPRRLAGGFRERLVLEDEYNHFEILELSDIRSGRREWHAKPVSIQEAMTRVREGKPVVMRDHGPGVRFLFSLAKGETVEIIENGEARLAVVRTLEATTDKVGLQYLTDAQPYQGKNRKRIAVNQLISAYHCRKVAVSPLGEIHPAND